jgi:L-asparaginase
VEDILIISTGGTFNKIYNPCTGELEVDAEAQALKQITDKWLCRFKFETIIGKDSLDMDDNDRQRLARMVGEAPQNKIIVIHGTDTMDQSAQKIASENMDKAVVLTGAMMPYSIDPTEATANLASAIGFIASTHPNGVYIAMNGVLGSYDKVAKDREKGRFVAVK